MRRTDLLALVLLSSLGAQAPTQPTETLHPDKKLVVEEVTRKRDDMRGGRVARYNVRVKVRLKNGARLSGVVKNGRLVERAQGIEFVEADRAMPEAGIRLHYFDETTSFIFLRWADIESHHVVVKLSDDEVRALEHELNARERRRQDERQRTQPNPDITAPPPEGPGDQSTEPGKDGKGDKDGKGGKDAEPAKEPTPLLTEFPPAEGWGEAKVEEIQRRKVVIGAFPNDKEKRFLEVFAEWKQQYARSQAESSATKPPAKPAANSEAPEKPAAPGK